ncbi:hypothetical protein PybrP1_005956 [[Pythium] brassicae (nom. inval.)]|nr:hypothetical protein PybrP1_005956 [[Pythium] brassicae (nom. inval.)]
MPAVGGGARRSHNVGASRVTSDTISLSTVTVDLSGSQSTGPAPNAPGSRRRHRTPHKPEPPSSGPTSSKTAGAGPSSGGATGGASVAGVGAATRASSRHSRSRSAGSFTRALAAGALTSGTGTTAAGASLERKQSTQSASMREQLLGAQPPLSGSGGPVDPTQRAATVWSVFMQTVLRHSSHSTAIALSGGERSRGADPAAADTETHYSWVQYYERAYAAARALAHFGFAPGEGAVICAKSAPAVHFLNLAVVACGGVVSHVRATWSADELVDHIFEDCNARVLVLDALHESFVAALRRAGPRFRAVILLRGDPMDLVAALNAPVVPVVAIEDLWSVAQSAGDDVLLELAGTDRAAAAHACCLMAFAYDEQGRVRGARLSQDNVMFTAAAVAASFGPLVREDRLVGYLPLHHVAAQVLELYMPLVCAVSVVCAPSYAEPLMKVITGKKPTIFFATPATWARVSMQVYKAKREVNSVLYRWAKTRATNNSKKLLFGQAAHRSLGYMLAKTLVLNSIKKRIGLESCHACYSVLAPLDFELEKLFKTIDIPIYQVFGCAETTGFAALNYPHAWEFGSSGRALKGTAITCDEETQEVLLRGRNVFAGYGALEPSAASSSGLERWFRFRQRGFLTPNGFLKINDPQDFVVLSSGDWVPVKPYEDALLRLEPALDRVVLVGEGRPFLSVMLFLKVAAAKSGGAAALGDDALRVGKSIGSAAATVADAIKCQAWAVRFDDALEALATHGGLSGFFVRKWILMADAFAVESGEIDPDTGAVTRKVVDGKYQSLLDSLYT